MDGGDGEVVSSIGLDGATVEVLPSDTVDPAEARARIEAERERLQAETRQGARQALQQGLHGQGAAGAGAGRAREARALRDRAGRAGRVSRWACRKPSRAMREAERYLRLARDVRHALRPRAHAAPDDRARLAPGALRARSTSLGSNGKSSTARMIAALLEQPGCADRRLPVAAPGSWAERIEVGGQPGARRALRGGDRSRRRGRRAGRPHARARRPRDAVRGADGRGLLGAGPAPASRWRSVEAGLGGRYDATSVIRSAVQVLTNVSLEHTRWLGPTETPHRRGEARGRARGRHRRRGPARARGTRRRGAGDGRARRAAAAAGPRLSTTPACRCVRAGRSSARTSPSRWLRRRPSRRRSTRPHVRAAAQSVRTPGRLEVVARRPAHDPRRCAQPGRAPRRSRRRSARLVGERPLVGVMSVLDDKDASSMLAHCCRCSARSCSRARRDRGALPAGDAREPCAAARRPGRRRSSRRRGAALTRARELAGRDGAVVVTGSIYLLSDLARDGALAGRRVTQHARMLGLVALVVAVVILVFFALGYGLGRLLL